MENKTMNSAYHGKESEADNSQTPPYIIDQIQRLTNATIVLDVCATTLSAKAPKFYTKKDDAMNQDWAGDIYKQALTYPKRVVNPAAWMNPPFSLANKFVRYAAEQARNGATILSCVKHAPDVSWFQFIEATASYIWVPDGRIQFTKFDGSPFMRLDKKQNKMVKSGANFPVCFPVWTPNINGGKAELIRFIREPYDEDYFTVN